MAAMNSDLGAFALSARRISATSEASVVAVNSAFHVDPRIGVESSSTLRVDTSASQGVTGLLVANAPAGSGVRVSAISGPGVANEALNIDALGSGAMNVALRSATSGNVTVGSTLVVTGPEQDASHPVFLADQDRDNARTGGTCGLRVRSDSDTAAVELISIGSQNVDINLFAAGTGALNLQMDHHSTAGSVNIGGSLVIHTNNGSNNTTTLNTNGDVTASGDVTGNNVFSRGSLTIGANNVTPLLISSLTTTYQGQSDTW